ncbi:site-specific DNA-methyltransferase [Polaribacter sp. MSW13]|uniref:site-specific DNA-methyltransferase (adenine-specific) n=1 Tax=Polaribacter marinus TaxID=2916838 RepID=A0A9X1VT46_9FLAO|nr:site-specific DNA-methyltransferase [Polaribacter marinus]MCI2230350.1 site-specific DNA-methyltransferase [Polaribacter marinus]
MPTLNWIGKDKVVSHHQDVPYKILEHKYGYNEKGQSKKETNSGNKIIHGDNLEALKALLPEYEGRVDMIYIDPPYNTGKEKWVYNDNVKHPKIQKWLGEVVGEDGEDLTRHDKWLCMMYPRIKLLHKLLKDDGVFYCSIDDNEHGNLKPMLDLIFGPNNFLNNVIWQRAYSPVNTKKRFSLNHDFVVCYAKNKNQVELLLPRSEDANDRYDNQDNDIRGVWKSSDLSVAPVIEDKLYPITTPSGRVVYPPQGRCWVLTETRFKEFLNDKRIWFGNNGDAVPSVKKFLTEVKDGITPMTVWPYSEVGHTQDAKKEIKMLFPKSKLPFETPKPTSLMEKILSLRNNPNAIILDSFAGTASTAHAVLNLNKKDGGNRKFIMVELEDYADSITATRIKKVIQGYDFSGKQKDILKEYSINITNLKKADKIIKQYEDYKNDTQYSKVALTDNNGAISIVGEKMVSGKTEGIGGSFDYYELGKPIFKDDENLNEEVGEDKIRNYIYYTETKQPLTRQQSKEGKYLLDNYQDTGYYFYYEKDSLTTLDNNSLGIISELQEQYIIYADICLLDEAYMLNKNIIFKKIPRDIKRF